MLKTSAETSLTDFFRPAQQNRAKLGQLGARLSHLGVMLGDLGARVGPCWAVLGPCWAHVGPSWGHLGPMLGRLGPSWSHVGPMLGHLGAILGLCWPYVGAVYVENIFRDKFERFFPPRKAKTVEKPTFFNIAKVQFCAAEGPETL